MKIKKTTPLLFFLLFSVIFSLEKTVAQTSVRIKNESTENEKYLIGFDEKATLASGCATARPVWSTTKTTGRPASRSSRSLLDVRCWTALKTSWKETMATTAATMS